MLTCGGCGVSRFCSSEHHKRAWEGKQHHVDFLSQVSITRAHKDVCGLLKAWKLGRKGKLDMDQCQKKVLQFLQKASDNSDLLHKSLTERIDESLPSLNKEDEEQNMEEKGCTANVLLIVAEDPLSRTPTTLICANAGDSRSVACIGGKAHGLSFDHKPQNPSERQRI